MSDPIEIVPCIDQIPSQAQQLTPFRRCVISVVLFKLLQRRLRIRVLPLDWPSEVRDQGRPFLPRGNTSGLESRRVDWLKHG
jgi:hypothetical protein